MVKVEENKVLSVIVDEVFTVDYDTHHYLSVFVYFNPNGEKEFITEFVAEKEPTTIEELKEIALKWHGNYVKRNVQATQIEVPTIAQLKLYSEDAIRAEVGGIQFIMGREIPILQIIKDGEVVTDYTGVGDIDEIYNIAELERYAIKWYYKNELGIDF